MGLRQSGLEGVVSLDWSHRNVLVTGAEGFLASWISKALVEEGANVIGLVRDSIAKSNFSLLNLEKNVTLVHASLTDYLSLERTLNEYEIEVVFHLAAQTIVGTANRDPLSTFESNVRGTYNVLEAARRMPLVRTILVASSDKAYGEHPTLPYQEDFPLQGRNPYDVSKSCADLISQAYAHAYGLPIVITRCGNIYGGGDLNFNRLVPGTIRSLLFGHNPIIRSDGSPIRDYVYVEDVAEVFLRIASMGTHHSLIGQTFNLGSGKPVSVREIAEKIIQIHGGNYKLEVQGKGVPAGEVEKQYLSSDKATRTFGWHAKTTLDEGLSKTIAWYKTYFGK
jgi:CDP-glucose 4,6-dehydratase